MKYKLGVLVLCASMLLTGCMGSKVAELKGLPLEDSLTEYELRDYYAESLSYDTLTRRTGTVHRTHYELVGVDKDTESKVVNYINSIEQGLSGDSASGVVSPEIHTYFKYLFDDKALSRKDIKVSEAVGHYFVDATYTYKPIATGTFIDSASYLGVQGAFIDGGNGEVILDTHLINATANKVGVDTQVRSNYGGIRYPIINTTDYNKVNGSILTSLPATPNVTQVYKTVGSGLGGYGLYPEGNFSLKEFGYNRGNLSGEVTIRYILEKRVGSNDVVGLKNLYVTSLTSNVDIKVNDNVKVADFVQVEADKLVERYDRAIINGDNTGLMNGLIVEDIGLAARSILLGKRINKQKNASEVEVIDVKGKNYLLEFETLRQEGLKGDTNLGTYNLKGYMVMTQVGDRFVITDYVLSGIELVEEPNLDTESDIKKRLVSLDLKGEVSEATQGEIKEALGLLYKAGTERNIDGLRGAFNSNTDLLSTLDKNYLVTKLQDYLTVYGGKVSSVYSGVVKEWLGGTDEQVELVATELVDYESKGKGIITDVYYVLSNYKGKWVIDEKDILVSKNIEGAELEEARLSIGSGKSVLINEPDNILIETNVGNNDKELGKDKEFTIDEKGKVITKDDKDKKEAISDETSVDDNKGATIE